MLYEYESFLHNTKFYLVIRDACRKERLVCHGCNSWLSQYGVEVDNDEEV